MILEFQRRPVAPGIVRVARAGVHVVRREYDLLAEQLVKQHQRGAVKQLEFVVPQNMEDLWFGSKGVADEPAIISQHAENFFQSPGFYALIAAQIEKTNLLGGVQLRAVHFVAADEIKLRAGRRQRRRQTERVRPVAAGRQQANLRVGSAHRSCSKTAVKTSGSGT